MHKILNISNRCEPHAAEYRRRWCQGQKDLQRSKQCVREEICCKDALHIKICSYVSKEEVIDVKT